MKKSVRVTAKNHHKSTGPSSNLNDMAVDREGKAVGPQISEELAAEMSKPIQKVTTIDEEGKVLPCDICRNPHPGMEHKCTDYLWYLIEKFGGHMAECSSRAWKPLYRHGKVTNIKVSAGKKCDCGWDEVKRP